MFKKLIIGIIIFSPSLLVQAGYFPPKDVQKLIEKTETLNEKCRGGSGDNPSTMVACDQREEIVKVIKKKGYCYGALNKDAPTSQYRWISCKLDATKTK